MQHRTTVTPADVREIAHLAECDERSVWKRLAGASAESGSLRPKVQARIDRAIEVRRLETPRTESR
jgi:hypothetical protein